MKKSRLIPVRNFVVDVAFTVEGCWDSCEDIPYDALIAGLEKRLEVLRRHEEGTEPFGFGDNYLVDDRPDTNGCGVKGWNHKSHREQ